MPSPEPVAVEAGPPGTRFGEVRHFATVDSTNRYLIDEAARAPDGLVVVADYQSAGRGRLGRSWEAPAGSNLLVSVLLRPALPAERLSACTRAVALAAAEACRGAGLDPELKWPNDLMVAGRKLAGILAESIPGAVGRDVVVGLGLNVTWPPPDHAVTDDQPSTHDRAVASGPAGSVAALATSLWRETGRRLHPNEVLASVLEALDSRIGDLETPAGMARQADEYRRRCATLGRPVRVVLPGEVVSGIALDITHDGLLVVDVGDGTRTISAGDVYDGSP
jgi:BirA family biotin operon repressor/biotin-[acetyl-CoA-carboxylase] ligase